MAQQIVIDIVAETKKLTEGFNKVDDEVKGVSKNLKTLTATAGAAASAFLLKKGITFLEQGIEEAKDAKIAMQQATTTFGEGSKALEKITKDAEKFGKELAIDNDELIKLATQLGSRLPKEIQESSVELVKIFKDVEAFTGGAISAEAASGKLAKAFADGELKASELQKIFPGLEQATYDQAEALSKAGDNQGALNKLVEEGSKKYDDAAAKNVTATQKFDTALANFKETLGEKVLPILEKGIDFLTKLLEKFDALPTPVQNFSLGLLALVAVGGPLLTFIASIKTAAETLGILSVATGGATTATGLFSAALRLIPIIAIIGLIVLLIQNWDDVSAAAKKLWENITKWWNNIYEDIKDFAGKAIKWIEDNWPKILAVLTGPFGLFVAFLVTHKDEVIAKLKDLWENAKTAITEKLDAIKTVFTDKWNEIKTSVSQTVEKIIGTVVYWWDALKEWIKDYFSDKAESFLGAIKTGWNAVKDAVGAIVDTIKYVVGTKFLEMFNTVVEWVTAIKIGVVEKFNELKDKAIEKFEELKKSASTVWNNIKKYITDVATNIKTELDKVYNNMVQVGKDIANGIIDGLFKIQGVFRTKLTQWVKDNIPEVVKKALQISSPSKVMMKIGGDISEGLYSGMGVQGRPGITLPQINVGSAGAGNNVTINITTGPGTDPYSVGRAVQQALNRYTTISK